MTDCSSNHGSTSSSSDVMTLTTAASSWCAIPTNSRIRVLRLVRPHHTRRMLMVTGPESNPSFGFAVRGGKEFGTGFFVSQVERNSEADLKGLRIGDQILRLNNFRVEDAVHKEFIRFINSQDRITLKVRGVGMLPIKDKEHERLSWNVVKMHSISNTPSESSYKTVTTENSSSCSAVVGANDLRSSKDISVVLDVAPRTKLGLGICKGPEWKPGIFVQFTKDKSVAREAGLRPGDQILSVNSIDFSDVLFSEAVAVMKSSSKLEMIVRTAAGCDLFPGESSGYNSSASSVTGDQSPCWGDVKQKRLTAVSEEPVPTACWNEALYAEQRRNGRDLRPKEVNKTIIKLTESGTSINNTYIDNPHLSSRHCISNGSGLRLSNNLPQENTLKKTPATASPSTAALYSNVEQQPGRIKNLKIDGAARGSGNNAISVDVHRNRSSEGEKHKPAMATLQRGPTKATTKQATSMGPPKAPPPVLYGNSANYSNNKGSSSSNNGATSGNQSSAKSNNFVDVGAAGSTLSSAINEELKKRKEKQRSASNVDNNNSSNNYSYSTSHNEHQHRMTPSSGIVAIAMQRQQHQPHQRQTYQNHPQQQASTMTASLASSPPSTSSLLPSSTSPSPSPSPSSSSSAVTSPAKRAPSVRAVNSNVANCSDRGNTLDQHSALMDEFKRAHQRMFKNGFHERESKERQEALKRTTIMDDDSSHRTSRHLTNGKSNVSDAVDGYQQHQSNNHQPNIPPPPPQFANSPPKDNQSNGIYNYQTIKLANGATNSLNSASTKAPKPPSSPIPDYDNLQHHTKANTDQQIQINSLKTISKQNGTTTNCINSTNSNSAVPPSPTRRTIRRGAVTIGEYEQQRKEPNKFEFIGSQNVAHSGSNASKNGNNFQSELQSTLSRSKLKNGGVGVGVGCGSGSGGSHHHHHLEHKRDCPLRNGYGVENSTRNQKQTLNGVEGTATVKRNIGSNIYSNAPGQNGILKNGNSRNSATGGLNGINGHNSKITEKTITFGN